MGELDRSFWTGLTLFSTLPLFCSSLQLEFIKKSTGPTSVWLSVILYFVIFGVPLGLCVACSDPSDPKPKKLFRGYKQTGRIIGTFLVFFGNVGLYYFTEKSVACMLTFLFLALTFLCTLCCVQPCTDFGIPEFLLSTSLNVALCRFGFHFFSGLVLAACIIIDSRRYWLDPEREEHQVPVTVEANSEPIGLQSHTLVASNGTEENQQLSITEISNGTEEDPLSIVVYSEHTNSSAGEESLRSRVNRRN